MVLAPVQACLRQKLLILGFGGEAERYGLKSTALAQRHFGSRQLQARAELPQQGV